MPAGLLSAVCLLIALVLPTPASAISQRARSAHAFVQSVGYNTHLTYTNTSYARFDEVRSALARLRARHIREALFADRPDQYQRLAQLGAAGVSLTLFMDPRYGELDELMKVLDDHPALRRAVVGIQGPNEWDQRGTSDWAAELRRYQARLQRAVRSRPSLSHVKVLGPSFAKHSSFRVAGDLSSYFDIGTLHTYSDGWPPSAALRYRMDVARQVAGSRPLISTETGYHNAVRWPLEWGHVPVSEAAVATYMPQSFLTHFRFRIRRTFVYELVDQFPNPRRDHRESNFGLLRNDFSPKPSFRTLSTLMQLLDDPGTGRPARLRRLRFSLSGDLDHERHLLLQKRDGSLYLALWRDRTVWDRQALRDLPPPAGTITVRFRQPVRRAQVYRVSRGTRPVARRSRPAAISLSVTPSPVLIRLVPG